MNRAERRALARKLGGVSRSDPADLLAELDRAIQARLDRGETPEEAAAAVDEFSRRTAETPAAEVMFGPAGHQWLIEQLDERRRRLVGGDPR